MKRKDYIGWNEYFMGIALLSARRSKDPSTQVGACIVSQDNRILSVGYNGMPHHCNDDEFHWERDGEALNTQYYFVCHAELNTILNYSGGNGSLKGSKVYTTLFPCNECAKALIQSGVGEIIYYSDKYSDSDSTLASKMMFKAAGIKLTPYEFLGKQEIVEL